MRKLTFIAAAVSVAILAGCQQAPQQTTPAPAVQAQPVQSEIDKANAFFEDTFNRDVMSSPVYQTYMGIKKDYDKWDDGSEEQKLKDLAQAKEDLVTLNAINRDLLDDATTVER
jgi:flagellar motility protein MotE (MotC chaperone)